jgi:hypothetical protein
LLRVAQGLSLELALPFSEAGAGQRVRVFTAAVWTWSADNSRSLSGRNILR